MRALILKLNSLHEALSILAGQDKAMRSHLESLLIKEWEGSYNTGYSQALKDKEAKDWDNNESHV